MRGSVEMCHQPLLSVCDRHGTTPAFILSLCLVSISFELCFCSPPPPEWMFLVVHQLVTEFVCVPCGAAGQEVPTVGLSELILLKIAACCGKKKIYQPRWWEQSEWTRRLKRKAVGRKTTSWCRSHHRTKDSWRILKIIIITKDLFIHSKVLWFKSAELDDWCFLISTKNYFFAIWAILTIYHMQVPIQITSFLERCMFAHIYFWISGPHLLSVQL